jgi:hypothetical protein
LLALALVLAAPGVRPAAAQSPADAAADGAAADSAAAPPIAEFEEMEDRWSIKPPPYELNVQGHWYDPYNQNKLKGDYPIIGQNTFFVLTATGEGIGELARVPLPSGISTDNPLSEPFFGDPDRIVFRQNLKLTLELYHGQTAFRPRDWEIKFTPVLQVNYAGLGENNGVNINVRKGTSRTDEHLGIQELSFEKHLFDLSERFDFLSARIGIQKFNSDFRALLFKDYNLGARLLGNAAGNRYQYNLAYFDLLEKDTNSELNTIFDDRKQEVFLANLYRQDTFALGYTMQISFHLNRDEASVHFDENGFPVRPSVLGNVRPHEIEAYYLGWTGDGHFGRLNVNHAFYQAFGTDDFNSVAGRPVDINARLAALELSIDVDWKRYRASVLYASGDAEPMDDVAEGFDSILEEPFFAGGDFSYWNQQEIRIAGVALVNKLGHLPNLRSNKFEGQSNFVNPGLFLANVGFDAEVTTKLKAVTNVTYLSFVETAVLQPFLNQQDIDDAIGIDASLGLLYRPFLNNNMIVKLGAAALAPLDGFDAIYESPGTQYSAFSALVLTY